MCQGPCKISDIPDLLKDSARSLWICHGFCSLEREDLLRISTEKIYWESLGRSLCKILRSIQDECHSNKTWNLTGFRSTSPTSVCMSWRSNISNGHASHKVLSATKTQKSQCTAFCLSLGRLQEHCPCQDKWTWDSQSSVLPLPCGINIYRIRKCNLCHSTPILSEVLCVLRFCKLTKCWDCNIPLWNVLQDSSTAPATHGKTFWYESARSPASQELFVVRARMHTVCASRRHRDRLREFGIIFRWVMTNTHANPEKHFQTKFLVWDQSFVKTKLN